jgi:predicted TIM-barrel fold metal-dependent hydrolase
MTKSKRLSRRKIVLGVVGLGLAGAAYRYWPEDGFVNPCLAEPIPASLLKHELIEAAWEGIDPTRLWDCHVHLIGTGDSESGLWVNPNMQSMKHPVQWAQRAFYLNASCTPDGGKSDQVYVERLSGLLHQIPVGVKLMLLAFDYFHDENGQRMPEASAFYTPNEYASNIALANPDRFEWIASIHPYRHDAVNALRDAFSKGARAVKWLPPAQGMDPASPQCDPFYEAATELGIPLLVHAGAELAVHGGNTEDFGNPLRLRRPLEHGVRVIVAHCASLGNGPDLDIGPDGPVVSSFELFGRMMDEPRYQGLLYGEISAVTQINRSGVALKTLLGRKDWHPRLLNGSDYPLPGILPLFSLQQLERGGFIRKNQSEILSAIRNYNPLLFDFALKRTLNFDGNSFGAGPFHTRGFFI